jgi:hypothetical protein
LLTVGRLTESEAPPYGGGGSPAPVATDSLLWVTLLSTAGICAPFFRYVQWLGDEGVTLHGADRIVRGERLYAEFFEFLPPGSFLVVAAWMQLIGSSFASMRVLAIGVIVAIAGLTYVAARLTSRNRVLAALLAIMWAAQSQGAWTVINHHWFTTAASMASAVALLWALGNARDGHTAIFLAGLFAGTAAMITTMRGALLGLAVMWLATTLPDRRRAIPCAAGGLAAFPVAVLVYLGLTGSIVPAYYDAIVLAARQYPEIQIVQFGAFTAPHHAPAVIFLPLTFVLTGIVAVVDGRAAWQEARLRGALASRGCRAAGRVPTTRSCSHQLRAATRMPALRVRHRPSAPPSRTPRAPHDERRAGRSRRRGHWVRRVQNDRTRRGLTPTGLHGSWDLSRFALALDRGRRRTRCRHRAHSQQRPILLLSL